MSGRTTERASRALAITGLVLVVAAVAARKLGDFDLPTELATGRFILQTGHIPRVDDFSYLHGTVRYVDVASVALFTSALRAGGPLGVQIVAGLAGGAIAVAVWLQSRRFGPIAVATTALAIASAGSFLVARSSALSFPLLAGVTLALDTHRRHANTPAGRRALGAFVLLCWLWANTHGSVPLGLLVGATYAGYRAACRAARGRAGSWLPEADGSDVVVAAVALVLAIALASLNTAGPGLLLGPLRWGGRLDVLGTFSEWARPTLAFFLDHEPVVAVTLAIAVLACAGRDADSGRRAPALYDLGLLAIAIACAATAVRLLPFAAILAAPWIARRLGSQVRATPLVQLACSSTGLLAATAIVLSPLPRGVGFDLSHLPEGAAQWAEVHHPRSRLWNPAPFGGYLAFRLYPQVQVLVDGRNGMAYDLKDVEIAQASERDPAAFADLVQAHDVGWAIVRAFGEPSGIPVAASKSWTMVFLDDVSAIYVRRDGGDGPLASDGYRILRHLATPEQVLSLAVHGGETAEALFHDGTLAAHDAPNSARSAFLEACGAIATRNEPAFRAAITRLSDVAPGHPALDALAAGWNAAKGAAGP